MSAEIAAKSQQESTEAQTPSTQNMVSANGADPDEGSVSTDTPAPAIVFHDADVASDGSSDDGVAGATGAASSDPEGVLSDDDRFRLLTRLVLGLAVVGADEAVVRLRRLQDDIDAYPELLGTDQLADEVTNGDLFRWLVVGTFVRGQSTLLNSVQSAYILSTGTAGSFFDRVDRLTSSRLLRPFRKPVDMALDRFVYQMNVSISEGRFEEENGRLLARESFVEIIDEFIDYISDNPKLADLISAQVGVQSVSMAGTVVDTGRQVSFATDKVIEGIVRKIFRLTPRDELPESPLEGKPQTMYQRDAEPAETADLGHDS